MVTDYKIVYGHDVWVLEKKVKEMLAEGWQPLDGLQMSTPVKDNTITPFYTQVMVKNG